MIFLEVQNFLKALNIPFTINERLVRGLDYYTHTAFEITSNQLGSQATVCGGGRYDRLVEQLGGPSTPAIGWALGMERLVLLISKIEQRSNVSSPDIYLVNKGIGAEQLALKMTRALRLKNRSVQLDLSGSAFSKQLKRADKSCARWAIVIGDNEVEKNEFIIKDLRSREDSKDELLSWNSLLQRFA